MAGSDELVQGSVGGRGVAEGSGRTDRPSRTGKTSRTNTAFPCEECGRVFHRRSNLSRHQRLHSGQPERVCGLCSRKFVSQSCLNVHLKRIHGGVHCGDKQEEDKDVGGVRSKLQGGGAGGGRSKVRAKVECEVCHKIFRKPSHLRHHQYTHTGERPYPCPQCGRRFSEAGSLRRHMTSHIRAHISLSHPVTPTPNTPNTPNTTQYLNSQPIHQNRHSSLSGDIEKSLQDTPGNPHNINNKEIELSHTSYLSSQSIPLNRHSSLSGDSEKGLQDPGNPHSINSEERQGIGGSDRSVYIPKEFKEGCIKRDKDSLSCVIEKEGRTSLAQSCSLLPQPYVAVSLFLFGKRVKEEAGMEEGEEMSVKEELDLIEEAV
ncbi:Zinc finger protein 39 [Portunus trituberculatus]|uniref:Zinc finger protein 39 n=1 Tax=Portunus trituberculatus TaxID=210409 RepID=A0A5B7FEX0_PORTR|nr:Zinc finger protein 39 [Portunus trituberculatus]